jgi:tRNA-2-methylthio-N6-dimethylallyladenosine synthase
VTYSEKINLFIKTKTDDPKAFIRVFGCQQNEADAEKICGFVLKSGFRFVECEQESDLIIFVTCAVRHTAQNKIFGHIGRLKKIKEINPNVFIVIFGCMAEQKEICEKIRLHYKFIDLVIGSKSIDAFPKLLCEEITGENYNICEKIPEEMPVKRKSNFKAWVSIISGCNNFCSYCVVPFVRGQEKSRSASEILNEINHLVKKGYKDITLLGQNVNSYEDGKICFSDLILEINKIKGDFFLNFMTSHPKNMNKEIIDALAESPHFGGRFHLPVQSGSNRILKLMNRNYTKQKYLEIINYARLKIPYLTITSDLIVGFPGELREDFEETLDLIKLAKFSSIFTFIYSKRKGTVAEKMPDLTPHSEKISRFNELANIQNSISEKIFTKEIGKKHKILIESCQDNMALCRTGGGVIVKIKGKYSELLGTFAECKITSAQRSFLWGNLI